MTVDMSKNSLGTQVRLENEALAVEPESEPAVSLKGLPVGTKFKNRFGSVLKIVNNNRLAPYSIAAESIDDDEEKCTLTPEGCYLRGEISRFDCVEIISVPDPDPEYKKLGDWTLNELHDFKTLATINKDEMIVEYSGSSSEWFVKDPEAEFERFYFYRLVPKPIPVIHSSSVPAGIYTDADGHKLEIAP